MTTGRAGRDTALNMLLSLPGWGLQYHMPIHYLGDSRTRQAVSPWNLPFLSFTLLNAWPKSCVPHNPTRGSLPVQTNQQLQSPLEKLGPSQVSGERGQGSRSPDHVLHRRAQHLPLDLGWQHSETGMEGGRGDGGMLRCTSPQNAM